MGDAMQTFGTYAAGSIETDGWGHMPSRYFVQRRRIVATWLFASLLGGLVLISESHWDVNGALVGELLLLVGLALLGVATVGRLWCSLYISGYKKSTLITLGPYSICRNPLYFFSFLGGIGVGFCSETVTMALLIAAGFLLYYPFVIRAEERTLRRRHGDVFDEYVAKTPRFWPSLGLLQEPEEYTVKPKVFRGAVFDAMVFVWIAGMLELVEALHAQHVIRPLLQLY